MDSRRNDARPTAADWTIETPLIENNRKTESCVDAADFVFPFPRAGLGVLSSVDLHEGEPAWD